MAQNVIAKLLLRLSNIAFYPNVRENKEKSKPFSPCLVDFEKSCSSAYRYLVPWFNARK